MSLNSSGLRSVDVPEQWILGGTRAVDDQNRQHDGCGGCEQPRGRGRGAEHAASRSITPQLAAGCANPSPTKDNVASAVMNAGTRTVACTARNPRVAGSRWRETTRQNPAPSARAASAYSDWLSMTMIPRTPRAAVGHPTSERTATRAPKTCHGGRTI